MKNKYAFFISVLTFLICQVNAQQLLLNEGFESGILSTSSLNSSGNTPEVVTSQVARRGTFVMKSQLNNSSSDPERSEVSLNKLPDHNFAIGQEYWVGISTKLDEDFNQGTFTDDGMIMQWHYRDWLPEYTDNFKPQPFLLRYKKINGEKKIVFQHEFVDKSDNNKNKTLDLKVVRAYIGVGDDWFINIRFSETNGKFKVWRNGELVLDWSGNNHLTERPDGAYLKWGLYSFQYDDISFPNNPNYTRIPVGYSRTVYHDEVRMADATGSFDLVSPASNIWTGNINTDWATAGNWDKGVVPIATDNVIIPEVTNAPVIGASTAAVCNNLTITETDGLTVSIGGTLTVNGTSSGAIYYMSEELVPNGDFSNTADDLGVDGDTGLGDWRLEAINDAVATGDIFDEAGNNVFRAVVTTVPVKVFDLRLRQQAVVCPATAIKVIFRAKASAGNMSLKVQFDGNGAVKPSSTKSLTTSWADYELALPASSQGTTNRLQFQLLNTGTYYIDDVAFLTTSNTVTWTGATDSDWATATNWSPNNVPTATNNVVIPEVTNAPIVGAATTAVCNNLTITETDGVTVSLGGTLTVNGTSSGTINYINYELVPNGDFATGDYTSWSNSSNNGASSTPEVVLESGNYVAKKTVTATGSNPYDLRTRNRSITAPANATKITFRAKGDGGEQLYLTFGGNPNKVTTTVTLTNQWVDYELPLTNSGGGNAAGTTSDVDFQQLSTGVYYLDDVAFAFPVTWTGATDSDWATASNWSPNKVPTATDDAVIPDVETAPIIGASTAAVCANLTITETDGLVINSGGSLIVNGTSSGNVTYNRNLGTENWYLVSSPVAGQTYDNTYIASNSLAINGTNNAIGSYTTADNTWSYMQTGGGATFTAGQGYSVRRATGQGAGNISFTGTINTSDVSYNPTVGFNLIGNPFTSSINSASLLSDNTANLVTQTIWVWNQSTGNYETKVTGDTFVLAAAQGFFINSSNGTNINIAESYQTTGGTFQKTAKTEIKLMINDGTSERFARINYTNNATKGFDNGFDGETFGGVANSVDVFTHLVANSVGKKYQVQSLPNSDFENMVVPVGIKAAAGKEITFSAEAMNLSDGINVYLEDRATNTVTLLSEANATYKVTLGESLDGIGRFYLHTKASGVLSTTDVALDNISIYSPAKSSLRIVGLSQGRANVKIYNILGKQVLNTSFVSNGVQDIALPKLTTGIYIVQLENENGTLNKKIILE